MMRILWLTLTAGLLMPFFINAEESFLSDRAEYLMAQLDVKEMSEKEQPDRRAAPMLEQALNKDNFFVVTHEIAAEADNDTSEVWLIFSDLNGNRLGTTLVESTKSAKEAQTMLFERLVSSSMPIPLVASVFEVQRDGPGDLCIIIKKKCKSTDRSVVDESKILFIRDNVLLSVYMDNAEVNARELAQQMDQILLSESTENGVVTPATTDATMNEESRTVDDDAVSNDEKDSDSLDAEQNTPQNIELTDSEDLFSRRWLYGLLIIAGGILFWMVRKFLGRKK